MATVGDGPEPVTIDPGGSPASSSMTAGDSPLSGTFEAGDNFEIEYEYIVDENGFVLSDENSNKIYSDIIGGDLYATIPAGDTPSSTTFTPGDMV